MNPELDYALMHHHQVVRNESSAITTSSEIDEEEEEEMEEEQTNNHHEEEVDEEAEGDDEEDDEEDEENESRPSSKHQLIRPVATSVSSTTATALAAYQQHQSIYQQNCLAAAQMAQLIAAGVNPQSIQTQQTVASQPTANNIEKENIPICKFCSKQFANFSNLNHHISAIHLNQSKWVCSQCGKICSSKSNLKVHLRVHLRVKPYHCRWCSYSCMHHSSIRDHLAKVHPDKVHTPLQPGYMFNSQAVPEPEVFNSKGFNPNTFASEKNAADAAAAAAATPTSQQQQFKRSPSIDAGVNEQMSPDRQIRLHKKQKVLYHVVYRLLIGYFDTLRSKNPIKTI